MCRYVPSPLIPTGIRKLGCVPWHKAGESIGSVQTCQLLFKPHWPSVGGGNGHLYCVVGMRVKTFFGADAGRWRWAQGRWMHVVAPERRDQPARGGFSAPDAVSSASGLIAAQWVCAEAPWGVTAGHDTRVGAKRGWFVDTQPHTLSHMCAAHTGHSTATGAASDGAFDRRREARRPPRAHGSQDG